MTASNVNSGGVQPRALQSCFGTFGGRAGCGGCGRGGAGAWRRLAAAARAPDAARDEAIFWLSAAAEIEHALMVQYLFAAYSIEPASLPAENNVRRLATEIRNTLLQIAREEMGHFISVQNLLHAVGGALHFGRQFSPFEFAIQPFAYRLEPADAGLARQIRHCRESEPPSLRTGPAARPDAGRRYQAETCRRHQPARRPQQRRQPAVARRRAVRAPA